MPSKWIWVVAGLVITSTALLAAKAAPENRETRQVAAFSGIVATSGIAVRVTKGPAGKLTLEGDAADLARVKAEVRDGVLYLGFAPQRRLLRSDVQVELAAPGLSLLRASAGSTIESAVGARGDQLTLEGTAGGRVHCTLPLRANEIVVSAAGGGEVSAQLAKVRRLVVEAAGGGEVDLAGDADALRLDYSGGGVVHADRLTTPAAEIDGSGGGVAELAGAARVRGSVSGGATLRIKKSTPSVVDASGGAEVERTS